MHYSYSGEQFSINSNLQGKSYCADNNDEVDGDCDLEGGYENEGTRNEF